MTTDTKLVIPFDRMDVHQVRNSTEESSLVDRTCQNPIGVLTDEEENDHG